MKSLERLQRRITALQPTPELATDEADILLFKAFCAAYPGQLEALRIPESIQAKVLAALAKTHPTRPFGHTRPDDVPYWMPLDHVISDHWQEWGWQLKAASFSAWADVYEALDDSEIAETYRRTALECMEYDH